MSIDLDDLERLAQAATPGPWRAMISIHGKRWWVTAEKEWPGFMLAECYDHDQKVKWNSYVPETYNGPANVSYIAAMHPQTTLALIARIRELE